VLGRKSEYEADAATLYQGHVVMQPPVQACCVCLRECQRDCGENLLKDPNLIMLRQGKLRWHALQYGNQLIHHGPAPQKKVGFLK
jgi:hypothetical protein